VSEFSDRATGAEGEVEEEAAGSEVAVAG